MHTHSFQRISSNPKTGRMSTCYTSRSSCPPACPLRGLCYGECSINTRTAWDRLDHGGLSTGELAEQLQSLPSGHKVRLNVTGDLPGSRNRLSAHDCSKLSAACVQKRVFTYTHYPATEHNLAVLRGMRHITVNLSANSPSHADRLAATGFPVVVVMPAAFTGTTTTPAGRRIVQCPATKAGSSITCDCCMLCASRRPDRPIVGFPAHGTGARRAEQICRD